MVDSPLFLSLPNSHAYPPQPQCPHSLEPSFLVVDGSQNLVELRDCLGSLCWVYNLVYPAKEIKQQKQNKSKVQKTLEINTRTNK